MVWGGGLGIAVELTINQPDFQEKRGGADYSQPQLFSTATSFLSTAYAIYYREVHISIGGLFARDIVLF